MVISIISYLIFTNALTKVKEKTVHFARITILSLFSTCLICYNSLFFLGLDKGIALFGGIFNITSLTHSLNIFLIGISSVILLYNSFYHRSLITDISNKLSYLLAKKERYNPLEIGDNKTEQYTIIEYPLIILFIICGAIFLMSSADLISLFISIELQSYGLYILSTLYRDSEQSTWGGLTYFLLGGLSSCFILLGSALLYINSGTTSLDGIYIISTITEGGLAPLSSYTLPSYNDSTSGVNSLGYAISNMGLSTGSLALFDFYYIYISLTVLLVGFLFKVSAAPFHFWSPDVYDAIPTVVTTYVAIIAKISIFVFLLELIFYLTLDTNVSTSIGSNNIAYSVLNDSTLLNSWKNCLLISALFSLIIGSVLGLTQQRIKRVYAYSTISHVGFILLALSINKTESIQAYIFYIISYSISNLNAFITLVTIGYTMYLYKYKGENPDISQKVSKISNEQGNDTDREKAEYTSQSMPLSPTLQVNSAQDILTIEHAFKNNKILSYTETFKNTSETDGYKNTKKSLVQGATTGNKYLKDIDNSPIQLVSQLKGYFYLNPVLSLSLAVSLFSFIGIPPLIGFFAKQMVLSAALDNGYIFITLVGIITSVIGAVYYLNIVKQMFFFKSDYVINPFLEAYDYLGTLGLATSDKENKNIKTMDALIFKTKDIKVSSSLSVTISILTLALLLFIFIPNESFNLAKILTLLLFN